MQNETEQQTGRRSRPGSWQFPNSTWPGEQDTHAHGTPPPSARPGQDWRGDSELRGAGGGDALATALGWLSLGLGLAHLLAPRALARASGLPAALPATPLLMRVVGVRELVCGVGLLNQPRHAAPNQPRPSARWRWSRLAGDAMDLAMLGMAASHGGSARKRLAASAAVVAGITALDAWAGAQAGAPRVQYRGDKEAVGVTTIEKNIIVNRSADDCYGAWRDLEHLPRFMQKLLSVRIVDTRRSHWTGKGPDGRSVEWDADITEDVPGQRLCWSAVPVPATASATASATAPGKAADAASARHNGASVSFQAAPGGRGTVVTVRLAYTAPAGKAGQAAARLLGDDPARQIEIDLRRFKQLLETAEITTTEGQPSGRRSLTVRLFTKGKHG